MTLEERTKCKVFKFVGKAYSDEDIVFQQQDIDVLSDWVKTWQREFNVVIVR